jgi:hypothetical protein
MRTAIASVAFLAAAVFTTPASTLAAGTATGQVLPEVVPPGAAISIDVFNCPAPATTTIGIEILPQGGVGFLDDSAAAVDGAAMFEEQLPIDAAPGPYTVRIFCKDTDATTIDTGELTFTVSTLGLQLSKSSGPVGTSVTVTGAGCPLGRTEFVALWFEGASDETPVWDPQRDGFVGMHNEDGTFAITFTVPSDAVLGENLISVWCVSEGGSALTGPFLTTFTVTESMVPETGVAQWPLVLTGAALLLAGMTLRRVSRTS